MTLCALQERLSGVRTIEKTIGELGAMFSKLAGLVSIQAEQIERIDTQVITAARQRRIFLARL